MSSYITILCNSEVGIIMTPTLQMGKPVLRILAPNFTAHKWQDWDLNHQACLIPKSEAVPWDGMQSSRTIF